MHVLEWTCFSESQKKDKINEINIYKGLSPANHVPSLEQLSWQTLVPWIGAVFTSLDLQSVFLHRIKAIKSLKSLHSISTPIY